MLFPNITKEKITEIKRKHFYFFVYIKICRFKPVKMMPIFYLNLMKSLYILIFTKRERDTFYYMNKKIYKQKNSQYRSFITNKIKKIYNTNLTQGIIHDVCIEIFEFLAYSSDNYITEQFDEEMFFDKGRIDALDEETKETIKDIYTGDYLLCTFYVPKKSRREIENLLKKCGITYIPDEYKSRIQEFAKLVLTEEELLEGGIEL
jgi:hypothetical protein